MIGLDQATFILIFIRSFSFLSIVSALSCSSQRKIQFKEYNIGSFKNKLDKVRKIVKNFSLYGIRMSSLSHFEGAIYIKSPSGEPVPVCSIKAPIRTLTEYRNLGRTTLPIYKSQPTDSRDRITISITEVSLPILRSSKNIAFSNHCKGYSEFAGHYEKYSYKNVGQSFDYAAFSAFEDFDYSAFGLKKHNRLWAPSNITHEALQCVQKDVLRVLKSADRISYEIEQESLPFFQKDFTHQKQACLNYLFFSVFVIGVISLIYFRPQEKSRAMQAISPNNRYNK